MTLDDFAKIVDTTLANRTPIKPAQNALLQRLRRNIVLKYLASRKRRAKRELPQLVTPTNYHDVVAVALAFADPAIRDMDLIIAIMKALRGASNPDAILAEIKRQRPKPETESE